MSALRRTLVLLMFAGVSAGWLMARADSRKDAAGASGDAGKETPAVERPDDDKAIRAASQAFAKAFSEGNGKAVAALFTETAEYLDEGSAPVKGRETLSAAYAKFFAERKGLTAESKTESIRFLGRDTAVEEGRFVVTPKSGSKTASRFSALYVREGGRWLIALLKEWGEERLQPGLEQLGWLVGTWESDSDEMTARTTYEWTVNKSFLRVHYTLTPKKKGEKTISGVQVIGVDPAVGLIRSWLFDEHGGIGESTWMWDGERWEIESIGTLTDGSRTTSVNFLTRKGNDAFSWKSAQRTQGGASLPDVGPVTVKRVAAAQ